MLKLSTNNKIYNMCALSTYMHGIMDFVKNKEDLKLCILDYDCFEVDLIHVSNKYYKEHSSILKSPQQKSLSEEEFGDKLYEYLWIPKISEMLIILYLEDKKDKHPTIWDLNRLLQRRTTQHSVTLRAIQKLSKLDIITTKTVTNAPRKNKQIFIKKEVVTIYGDDEFRKMMLEEWNEGSKKYIQMKLENLEKQKTKLEENIQRIKKGKRVKKNG